MADVGLKQELRGWQIFFIAISGVIGVTIFSNGGLTLEVAGPGGMLLAYAIIGIIAISVMEGVSEMIQLFPAPNAIVEYVKAFVDVDLAWVIGIAYWYTYASIFATLIIAAAGFTNYWGLAQVWQTLAFYVLSPLVILGINLCGVNLFGWIEAIGGFLKLSMVIGCGILMYVIAGKGDLEHQGSKYITNGFENNKDFAPNHPAAVCFAIPIIAYGFLGVEIVAMTAYEARDVKDLRRPSRIIAWVAFISYFFCALGEALNVKWIDQDLPVEYGASNRNGTGSVVKNARSRALVVLAAQHAGYKVVPGFLTGCMMFSVLSAANTSLYVASRVLYGMTREIRSEKWPFSWLQYFGTVRRSGAPGWALVFSALSFFWLPFLQLKAGYSIQNLIEIMSISASVSGLLVWASLCLAFIRYHWWLRMHRESLEGEDYAKYNRWDATSESSTVLSDFQPLVAYVGLIGCLLVVFVFSSALWWNGVVTFAKVASAFASPILLLCLWIIRKIIFSTMKSHRHQEGLFVRLDDDFTKLSDVLTRLAWEKPRPLELVQRRSVTEMLRFRKSKPALQQYELQRNMNDPDHLGANQPMNRASGSTTVDGMSTDRSDIALVPPFVDDHGVPQDGGQTYGRV